MDHHVRHVGWIVVWVVLAATVVRAENALVNGDFSSGELSGWTSWIVRDSSNDFTAVVNATELHISGSAIEGGVYQQFDTGGPGKVVNVIGTWRSEPTLPNAMWAEVWIINGDRVPANGVAEIDGANNAILLYRNDTFNGRGAWNNVMPKAAPVKYQVSFVAAAGRATIVLNTGNSGPATPTGAVFDDLAVSRIPPPATLTSLPNHFTLRTMSFPISGMAVMGQHPLNKKIYAIRNAGGSNIYRIDPASNPLTAVLVTSITGAGLEFTGGCQGMTFDAAGNLYVSSHNGDILKGTYNPATESFSFSVFLDLDETRVGGDHGVGGLAVGPDNKLYINSGSLLHGGVNEGPEPDNGLNARILRVGLDGAGLETFCKGIRNHFDIVFQQDGQLFGVENGPDCHYADEFNLLAQDNHYGCPFRYASDVSGSDGTLDAQCIFTPPPELTLTPAWANYGPDAKPGIGQPGYTDGGVYFGLTPHSSPDGLTFYETARMLPNASWFPPEYRGRAFIARFGEMVGVPEQAGFDVVSIRMDDAHQGFFCNTFLTGMARCIDVLAADSGKLYILEFNQQKSFGGAGGSAASRLHEISYTSPTTVLADFDLDGDVDQSDFGHLQNCFSVITGAVLSGCNDADINHDNCVNLSDFNIFLQCFSGADQPADIHCDDAMQ